MTELNSFTELFDYNQRIDELAAMAIPEPWSITGKNDKGILKNYMTYTFGRLKEENKIYMTDDYCIFNTGLFTSYYESIYVYAENCITENNQYCRFKRFLTDYDAGTIGIKNLPERANYFDDTSLLVYNVNLPIKVQYKHILEDEENYNRLPKIIKKSNTPINILKGTIDIAIKRVAANYRLAVPQYYNGTIQLLLPLCFTSTDKADLALVVTRHDSGYYLGHTCLTMEMAYNNARLIARPDSNWLVP